MIQKSQKPSAAGIAEGFENQIEFYEPENSIKACLCGQKFLPGSAFVIIETPIVTITRVCVACSATLAEGSFAERGELARLLLARAKGGER